MTRVNKPYHHGDLKQALLDSGLALLAEKGIAGLSLREVARHAGVSHSAPYRHFADKVALLAAIAGLGFQRLGEAMKQAVADHPGDPKRQLVAAGIAYVNLAVDNPEITHLMFGGILCEDDVRRENGQVGSEAFQGLVQIIENGIESRIYKPLPALELALVAWSGVHGLAMLISAGKLGEQAASRKQVEGLAELVASTVLSGMLKD